MTKTQQKAFVLGWPIDHSRSPLIHRFWLKKYNIKGKYKRLAVPPDMFGTSFLALHEKGYCGGNITIPHKVRAMEFVDEADLMARTIGAVNTVHFRDGKIFGSNTDGYGFITNLEDQAPRWQAASTSAVVLGAGGGARAVLAALLAKGVQKIYLANRTLEKAKQLEKLFGNRIETVDWQQRSQILGHAGLLVNTTSLGMTGKPALEINLEKLPPGAIVTDLVYTPLETRLLKNARKNGFTTVDGLGMLLHQAVPGFELWFGVCPKVTGKLRNHIIADLVAAS